jgi:hypothetical protein
MAYINIRSPFSRRVLMHNFSSIPTAFRRFFTWIALDNADLCFSMMLVRNANSVEEKIKRTA